MADPFRLYGPEECGGDGYPRAWHNLGDGTGVKHLVRERAGHRCVRCGHPYRCGESPAEWSPCDERCTHGSPYRLIVPDRGVMTVDVDEPERSVQQWRSHGTVEARYRVLTVHHLRLGEVAKRDLRWWNLAALCQRCHLQIQGKVVMERVWPWPHSEWFRPYAAGWYAHAYLGVDLSRSEVEARLDELLALERLA